MVKIHWLLAVLVVFLHFNLSESRKKVQPTIDVPEYGKVQGYLKATSWSQRKYLKFNNIKYATSSARFKPPICYVPEKDNKVDTSSGEKKHEYIVNRYKEKGIACPSLKTLEDYEWNSGDDDDEDLENCQFLTVSTRNKTGNQPVMVYLAGHDVVRQESDIGEVIPSYLMEKDVVLVAVQYRVGPFGFLSTFTNDIPGNVGILDVIEALRWVQKHIVHFGGDPKRVTLFGQYHSAAIINVLTLCPVIEAENLFHQVIYQSGSALIDEIATDKPLDCIKKIGSYMNCESVEDTTMLNKCLISAKAKDLLVAYGKYVDDNEGFPFLTVGCPSGLLPDFPHKLLKSGSFRGYPTIGGSVKHPGVCDAMKGMNSTVFRAMYKSDLDSLKKGLEKIGSKNDDQIKYVDEKFPNKIFYNNIFKTVLPAIIDIKGLDIKYATSTALQYNADKGFPSYLYAFNYLGFLSRLDCSKEVLHDVSLTDDSMYLFPYPKSAEDLTWKDIKMAKFMVDLWTLFAAMGCPSAPGLHKWPILEKHSLGPYLGIDFIYKMGFDYSEEYFVTLKDQMRDNNIYEDDK